jgi:hypothetical protein
MSLAAITWAFSLEDMSPSTKLVLLGLADNADRVNGECFPSQEELARKTCQSVDSVQKRIKELAEQDYIFRVKRKSPQGTRITDLYIVLFNGLARDHAIAHGWQSGAVAERSLERTAGEKTEVGENNHAANCGVDGEKNEVGEKNHTATGRNPHRNQAETTPQLCGVDIDEPSINRHITAPLPPKASEPDRVLEGGASLALEKSGEQKRAQERAETALAAWERFRRVWTFDPTELPEAARREFFRLSSEERDKAVAKAGDYLGECRRRLRKVAHAKTWLANKGWQAFEVGIGPSVVAKVTGSAALGDGRFSIYEGSPQAAAWREYLAANGKPPMKFIPRSRGPGFCVRESEWPPPTAREKAG